MIRCGHAEASDAQTMQHAVRYADSQHEVRMRIEFANPGTFSSIDPSDLSIEDG